jgi:hypothetical protein
VQKKGAKSIVVGAQSSQFWQHSFDWQALHRRNAVAYRKLNRGRIAALGSIPSRSIISKTWGGHSFTAVMK